MSQRKTHMNCKFFSYQSCPYKDNEMMKKVMQDIPQYYGGGKYTEVSFPEDEEVDAICAKCEKFIQK